MNLLTLAAARRHVLRLGRMATMSCVGSLVLALAAAGAFAAAPSHHVLVLNSDNRVLPSVAAIDEAFNTTLRARFGSKVEISNEFLDLDRVDRPAYHEQLVRFLREKYGGTPIDAVVAVRGPALQFLLAHRHELFPGVPVVHALVTSREILARELPPDVVGAPIQYEPAKTLDAALRMHPGTRRVVAITGTSERDHAAEAMLRSAFAPFADRVTVDFWAGLPLAEIMARLRQLGPGTIVFLPGMLQDATGQRFVPRQVAAEMIAASSVPFYNNFSTAMGNGVVGGYLVPLEDVGRIAAEMVAHLVTGESPTAIATPHAVPNVFMVDARQLRRFGVRESDLPPGAILKYREPGLWESYRWQIVVVLGLLLLQAALIVTLLVQRRIRRQAEARLRESEQRMNLAAEATGLGMWLADLARHEFWASPRHRALLGLADGEPYDFEHFLAAVHADDREHARLAIDNAVTRGGAYDVEYRVPLAGGRMRWVQSRGRVEFDSRGRSTRIRGVTSDITAQKEAELAAKRNRDELAHLSRVGMLGQLSGSLAHELNQPLTAILANAQAALRFLKSDSADLDEVRAILSDIVADDKRAGDVIRRLRALFERGEAKVEPVDLNELILEVLQLLRSDLVSRTVAVDTRLDPNLPVARGDRVQLQQLFLNLVLNACDAMAGVPAPERRLDIRTRSPDSGAIAVAVADRGTGIAADQLERIFEPFVTSKAFGIGLGLVIARSIAEAHGGRISAANNPGRGAVFTFMLPARTKERAPSASDSLGDAQAAAPSESG